MNVWNAFLIELEVLTLLLIKRFVITHTLYYMKSLLSQQHSYNYHALYTMHEFNSCIATNWLTNWFNISLVMHGLVLVVTIIY